MPSEADTCRKFVVPKLQAAGWDTDPHSIAEQRWFTNGRIVVRGTRAERRKGKRADYLLRYTRDFSIAVVEAKAEYRHAADGLQQAKDYAEILNLKFAYATNGAEIIEFDYTTGIERRIESFPSPAELWARLRAAEKMGDDAVAQRLLTPINLSTDKEPRYYQQVAINRAVQAILQGKRGVLLTMATGTGKTVVAFHICWKLWSSRWNSGNDPTRKPRILYLADRNFLVDDPKDKIFAPFGDARHKIEGGQAIFSRELYFATYQSIAKDERRPGLYKEFPRDFFDLVIVDECHRGSAKEDSNWREILEWFEPAYQLGMTATPLRQDNRDTYLYFGNPIYTYSLRQGIEDGFLAPYRVHRIVTQWDAAGWRPSKDDLDRYGREIPDEVYTTGDFERRVALRARTQAVARHVADFLKKTDRFAKTIVFCVDQEHASEMRAALNNLNADLVQQHPDYVCRVTADEGDIGRGHMQRFQDVETRTPVILTTSQLLTTGLDAPTCRNVVLVRLVNSMVEFKQIIGRGTRVREDYGKLWFNILDYTGTSTRNFADRAFDGDPAFATQEEIDEYGQVKDTEVITPEEPESEEPEDSQHTARPLVYQPSSMNHQPANSTSTAARSKSPPNWSTSSTPTANSSASSSSPTTPPNRSAPSAPARKISARAGPTPPSAPPSSSNWPSAVLTSRPLRPRPANPTPIRSTSSATSLSTGPCSPADSAATGSKKQQAAFFSFYAPEAREILNDLLEKYAADGEVQFTEPDVLKVPPISKRGNVAEIAKLFGGVDKLGAAVNRLQVLLYGT
jgi:type I restriction enzyme R subunit